ncbi:hypothetical protein HNQ94_000419 [Salirhabdus euzebyi]|uniref:Uncharacterized protein n=1 Tax=Salirhabdus euzebyi TaxID=394506 RepID=A0A841Q2Z2_9BACI|nr:hypothetical protein [Salirhabdus euzebyi]MBB6451998.1 hypothetical protein [Salirhabdus euzebyi]
MVKEDSIKKMIFKIAWKISEHRTDRRTGPISPIPRSKYAQLLFDEGAGWNEQKED